jgi:hypothetical protein
LIIPQGCLFFCEVPLSEGRISDGPKAGLMADLLQSEGREKRLSNPQSFKYFTNAQCSPESVCADLTRDVVLYYAKQI